MYFTLGIVLNRNGVSLLFTRWHRWNQVEHELIVYFKVGHADCVLIIEPAADLLEHLWNGPGDQSSVLVVLHASTHCESLSSTSLTIDHHSSVESVHNWSHDVPRACVKDVLLAGVMKDLVEFKTPAFLLVVDHSPRLILGYVHIDMLHIYG